MNNNGLTFRQFLELDEKKPGFFSAMQDEMGVDPDDFTKGSQIASFFSMGGNTFNLSPYKIIGFEYDMGGKPTHAKCQIINHPSNKIRKVYQKKHSKMLQVPDDDAGEPNTKVYLIPIEKLEKLMTQGLDQAGAAGGMGGMGGMPPM